MNIIQITPYYLPHIGGIERYVYNISNHFQALGNNVNVITSDIPHHADTTSDDFSVYRYPVMGEPLGNPIVTGLSDLPNRIANSDVVHIHGLYTYLAIRTIHALGKNHTQNVILTHHGRVVYTNSIKNILPKIYERTFGKYILRHVDSAVALSLSDKEQLMSLDLSEEKIHVIPNGIDTSLFQRPSDDELIVFRQKYQLDGRKVVLFLAAVSKRKGIFDIIHAMSVLGLANVQLLVVGNGPDFSRAVKLTEKLGVTDRVIFAGKISFSEILAAYSVADVYVLPSYFEGMPTTILEALAMGTPVIATDIPGVSDNFSEYVTLVSPHAPNQLSKTIFDIMSDTRKPLDQVCLNQIREKYDVQNVFSKYMDVYGGK